MNTDDLIERLAKDEFELLWGPHWDSAPEESQQTYREYQRVHLRAIVAFVAEWIERDGVRYDDRTGWKPQARMMRWREDMEA